MTKLIIPSWQKIFLNIDENKSLKVKEIANLQRTLYAGTISTLSEFEKRRLITKKKIGREKYVTLTQRGKEIRRALIFALIDFLEEDGESQKRKIVRDRVRESENTQNTHR